MKLELRRLNEIAPFEYVALHTNPLVTQHLPLGNTRFDEAVCLEWIRQKELMWTEYDYGPWAFIVNGRFAGWGGLQPQDGDADLALVLHPDYWGRGRAIAAEIIRRAFGQMRLSSITILLPPTRTRIGGVLRMGFVPDGLVHIAGERFNRFRLRAPHREVR